MDYRDVSSYPVYRCLDKPSSFFGVRGRFGLVAGIGLVLGLLLGLIVGSSFSSSLGYVTFFLTVVLMYIVLMGIQSKYSDRSFFRMLAFRQRAKFIRVKPMSVRSLLRWFM